MFRLAFRIASVTCLLATLCAAAPAWALSIQDVRFGTHPDRTRIVLELDQRAEFQVTVRQTPARMVVDLPASQWSAGAVTYPAASGIRAIHHEDIDRRHSRVVFDLDRPIAVQSAFFVPKDASRPHRLVIDVGANSGPVALAEPSAPQAQPTAPGRKTLGTLTFRGGRPVAEDVAARPTEPPVQVASIAIPPRKPEFDRSASQDLTMAAASRAPDPSPPPASPNTGERPLIVLDPGHGGQDPGAKGVTGAEEKRITLAMAKTLKNELEKSGRYRVRLTRTDDRYLRLHERVALGRKWGAALFVSLHADSISLSNENRKSIRGLSVYTLSDKASDAQTDKLAEQENRSDLIAGIDLSGEEQDVASILIDLAMRDTMNQSRFLASTLVSRVKKRGIATLDPAHRHAGFAVLKAPDVPSTLIELGFLSSPEEARNLADPLYRERLASGIADGIDAYFQKSAASALVSR